MKIFEKIGEKISHWASMQTYETIGQKISGAIFLTGVAAAVIGNNLGKTYYVDTRKCEDPEDSEMIDVTDECIIE